MEWDIEYKDEFDEWREGLTEGEQESVYAGVKGVGGARFTVSGPQ